MKFFTSFPTILEENLFAIKLPVQKDITMWKKLMKELNLTDSYISMGLGLLVVLVIGVLLFNYFSSKSNPEITDSGEQTQQGNLETSLPTTYTVAAGETLWSISEKFYKSGYNWVDIAKENNLGDANLIEEGQTIKIPQILQAQPTTVAAENQETIQAQPEVQPVAPATQNYTVKAGDTLWAIAVASYNDGYRWVDIAKANNLANPNIIHSGNVLVLP